MGQSSQSSLFILFVDLSAPIRQYPLALSLLSLTFPLTTHLSGQHPALQCTTSLQCQDKPQVSTASLSSTLAILQDHVWSWHQSQQSNLTTNTGLGITFGFGTSFRPQQSRQHPPFPGRDGLPPARWRALHSLVQIQTD
ncbi:hypothetical protein EMPS_08460 [Entomortierella parvispora]|uniref:Uncharacterized protein n=1 Tax=Entomortierella parvispora TaxID=205924 RepID=A0A9P3HGE6_9FUNG|nr:hypothetical protein EMPS_08460 [Entomortierella parvispora]